VFGTVTTTPAALRRELLRQPVGRVVIEAGSPAVCPGSTAGRAMLYLVSTTHSSRRSPRCMLKSPEAEAAYRRAVDLLEGLVADYPEVATHRAFLALSQRNLALVLRRQGQRPAAEAAIRKAVERFERLAADHPAVDDYRASLAGCYSILGTVLVDQRKYSEADAEYRKALAVRDKLVADRPGIASYTLDLMGAYSNLGLLARDRGEPAAALDWFAKEVATLEPVYRADPRNAQVRQSLCGSYLNRANVLLRLNRPAEALAELDRALELDDGLLRTHLRLARAIALTRTGEPARALAEADALAAETKLMTGQLYDLACAYSLAAGAKAPLPPADAERGADRAVEFLRRALANGYRNVAHMLRGRLNTGLRAAESGEYDRPHERTDAIPE
jgi:tetratricopeptide (TPR) repeat protein